MNIGQAAQASGLSPRMIRHYEQIGLLPKANRSQAGYRRYGTEALRRLAFICSARHLGLSIDQIRTLVALWLDRDRTSAAVKQLAQAHIDALAAKAQALNVMADALRELTTHCHGDDRPECPILDTLAGPNACRMASSANLHGPADRLAQP